MPFTGGRAGRRLRSACVPGRALDEADLVGCAGCAGLAPRSRRARMVRRGGAPGVRRGRNLAFVAHRCRVRRGAGGWGRAAATKRGSALVPGYDACQLVVTAPRGPVASSACHRRGPGSVDLADFDYEM
jgi:hypothetical protein